MPTRTGRLIAAGATTVAVTLAAIGAFTLGWHAAPEPPDVITTYTTEDP